MNYDKFDHDIYNTRNDFRTPEEIEIRRRVELEGLLKDWAKGASVWQVLRDIGYIFDCWTRNPFQEAGLIVEESHPYAEERAGRISAAQNYDRRFIKPEYFDEDRQNELHASILEFSRYIDEQEGISSYAIARSMIETICVPPIKSYEHDPENPVGNFLDAINEVEAKDKKSQIEITGSLEPVAERVLLKRLKPFIDKMKEGEEQDQARLIKAVHIDALGSGMIRAYHFNPDHLPEHLDKESLGIAESIDGWNPYARQYHKENIYGTTTATITTYSVSFEPVSADQLDSVRDKVQQAVLLLAQIKPTFGIPFDDASKPYKRPFVQTWRNKQGGLDVEKDNTDVFAKDGKVVIQECLDLDDVLNLYYLLEHQIEPSASVAHALNDAIVVEARSAPESRESMDDIYDTDSEPPDVQLAGLKHESPSTVFVKAIEDAVVLYAGNKTNEATFLRQIIEIAGHSLAGHLSDPQGAFPTYQYLLGQQKPGTAVLTFDDALKQRTHELLELIAGSDDASQEMVASTIMLKASLISSEVRDGWRLKKLCPSSRSSPMPKPLRPLRRRGAGKSLKQAKLPR